MRKSNLSGHGALSVSDGRVLVTWKVDRGSCRLRLIWKERGGPALRRPVQGFGSMLLEKGLAVQARGTVLLDWQPKGLRCAIEVPVRSAAQRRRRVIRTLPSCRTGRKSRSASLIVEDEVLDVNLHGRPTQPVAAALEARGIPFLWCTGYAEVPGVSPGAPVLTKPLDFGELRAVLAGRPPQSGLEPR